jgi:hypothetical protein
LDYLSPIEVEKQKTAKSAFLCSLFQGNIKDNPEKNASFTNFFKDLELICRKNLLHLINKFMVHPAGIYFLLLSVISISQDKLLNSEGKEHMMICFRFDI